MTLRVFGRVEQEAEDRRGELGAANTPGVQQRPLGRGSELFERSFDGLIECRDECGANPGREVRMGLGRQSCQLSGREALAARIREQAIETTGRMPCVKSDRGGAVGTSPDLLWSQSCDVRAHLFAALQQAVGNGLQQRRHGGNRATKPHFRRRHGREIRSRLQLAQVPKD